MEEQLKPEEEAMPEDRTALDGPDDSDKPEMFTFKAIVGGTVLGGPIAAAYLLAENFSAMQKEMPATYTRIVGVAATLIGIPLLMFLYSQIFLRPFVFMACIFWLIPVLAVAQHYQGEAIGMHIFNGGKKAPGWKAAVITSVNTVFLVLYIIGASYIIPSSDPGFSPYNIPGEKSSIYSDETSSSICDIADFETSVVQMEFSRCRVFYDADSIVRNDAKIAGAILEKADYFNFGSGRHDALFYKEKGKYIIAFDVGKGALKNKRVERILKKALTELRDAYRNRKYQFRLVVLDSGEITDERRIQVE